MNGRKNANVLWSLGYISSTPTHLVCTTCKHQFLKRTNNAANVQRHYKDQHPLKWPNVEEAERRKVKRQRTDSEVDNMSVASDTESMMSSQSSTTSSSALMSPTQVTLHATLMRKHPTHVLDSIATAFVMNSLPHHLVDNEHFRNMITTLIGQHTFAKSTLPSRKTVRNHIIKMAEKMEAVSVYVWE